uniref:Uncharacterized protein n=2 Tax=Clytia hemisphaerica TaxID=252671 RepID=A0A7M5X8V5_9CNID
MLSCCISAIPLWTGLACLIYYILDALWNFVQPKRIGEDNEAKTILITGCDSGFGYHTALDLSSAKCYILAGCLTKDGAYRLESDKKFNGKAFVMDVTKNDDITDAVKLVEKETENKGLYALINNAGIIRPSPIEWQTIEEMRRVMEVNFWGTVQVTKAFLPLLKKHGSSRIVNISSMAGRVLLGYSTSYCFSKYAVESFSDGLRYEMKPFGISVHLIEPGMYKTDILNPKTITNGLKKNWDETDEEMKEEYGEPYFNELSKRYEDLIEQIASPKFHQVVSAIHNATLSYNARARYVIGLDAHTLWMAISTFPTAVGDWISSKVAAPIKPAVVLKREKRK